MPDAKTAGKDAASREDRMLRGRLLGKGKGGRNQKGGKGFAVESESDEEPGRSGLGKRKRPRREEVAVGEEEVVDKVEEDGERDEEKVVDAEMGDDKREDDVVVEEENGGSGGNDDDERERNKKEKKRKKRQRERQKQKQKQTNSGP